MRAAIKPILLAAFAAPAIGGCSGEPNPDQNVVITDNVPADAEVEAVPADEGGTTADEGASAEVGESTNAE